MSRAALIAIACSLVVSVAHAQSVEEAGTALGDPVASPGAGPAEIATPPEAQEPEPTPLRYPRVTARPLTLPVGIARVEQLIHYRFFEIPLPMRGVPMGLAVGVHDDIEIGVGWGVLDDPSVRVVGRVLADRVVDLGVSAQLTVPAMTTGDTLLRVGVPVALRPAEWLRVDTGLYAELLFTAQVSPLAQIPLAVTIAPIELFFLGAMGSAGWLDGDDWVADAGGFVGWSARNEHGVIADGRLAVQVFMPGDDVTISLGLRFFPRFWR